MAIALHSARKRAAKSLQICLLWKRETQLKRTYTITTRLSQSTLRNDQDIDEFLTKPSWSVQSLLPTEKQIHETTEVTMQQLHHLLKLSALPPPKTMEEENKILHDLKSQLHFVKEVQKVETADVAPLSSIRDETAEAKKENEIGLETLKDALAQEEVVGKHHIRVRRKENTSGDTNSTEAWDVLGQAPSKVGKYFVVHHREES